MGWEYEDWVAHMIVRGAGWPETKAGVYVNSLEKDSSGNTSLF